MPSLEETLTMANKCRNMYFFLVIVIKTFDIFVFDYITYVVFTHTHTRAKGMTQFKVFLRTGCVIGECV